MKKRLLIVILVVVVFLLVGCGASTESETRPTVIQTCNVDTYKKSAQPLMREFSNIVKQFQFTDATNRAETKSNLESLLSKINRVKCRNDFPLEHETLEYSVRHMIDAIEYTDKGDLVEATNSINKSLLNVEAFKDWSVDID